jgi:ribosomal protein L37E
MAYSYNSVEEIELDGLTIKAGDVCRHLEKRTDPDASCPYCGHTSWHIALSPGHGKYPYFPTSEGSDSGTERTFPVAIVTCGGCAFVRPHALYSFYNWLNNEQRQKKDEADQGEAAP